MVGGTEGAEAWARERLWSVARFGFLIGIAGAGAFKGAAACSFDASGPGDRPAGLATDEGNMKSSRFMASGDEACARLWPWPWPWPWWWADFFSCWAMPLGAVRGSGLAVAAGGGCCCWWAEAGAACLWQAQRLAEGSQARGSRAAARGRRDMAASVPFIAIKLGAAHVHGHHAPGQVLHALCIGQLRLCARVQLPDLGAEGVVLLHLLGRVCAGAGGVVAKGREDGVVEHAAAGSVVGGSVLHGGLGHGKVHGRQRGGLVAGS